MKARSNILEKHDMLFARVFSGRKSNMEKVLGTRLGMYSQLFLPSGHVISIECQQRNHQYCSGA